MAKLSGTWNAIKKKMTRPVLCIMGIAVILSIWSCYNIHRETYVEDSRATLVKPTATLKQVSETKTVVSYEDKEYINGVKEDTDVQVQIEQPHVTVKVNGETQTFQLKQHETQKFEDGKVVLEQTSEVIFDVKVPNKNSIIVYTDAKVRGSDFHYGVGIEKQNGKFKYGVTYDLKDKKTEGYVRYDLLKATTE